MRWSVSKHKCSLGEGRQQRSHRGLGKGHLLRLWQEALDTPGSPGLEEPQTGLVSALLLVSASVRTASVGPSSEPSHSSRWGHKTGEQDLCSDEVPVPKE